VQLQNNNSKQMGQAAMVSGAALPPEANAQVSVETQL